jgi:hypothetical protein
MGCLGTTLYNFKKLFNVKYAVQQYQSKWKSPVCKAGGESHNASSKYTNKNILQNNCVLNPGEMINEKKL